MRAELTLEPKLLGVRVLVAKEELVPRLERDLAALAGALGGERAVRIQVRALADGEDALGERPLDIRFLRENRLLDVAG